MKQIFISAFVLNFLLFSGYLFLEPGIVSAVEDQVVITQTVTGEISITSPSDVTMSPSLASITGGTSNGYASWTITCTDNSGFIATLTASGTPANDYVLIGGSQGDWIDNYTEASYGVADYDWSVSSAAEFGYTATTTTAADLSAVFKTAASAAPCGTGSTMEEAQCWIAASTTARTLMTRNSEAPAGTVLGVQFRAQINGHTVIEDFYYATTTITATTQ